MSEEGDRIDRVDLRPQNPLDDLLWGIAGDKGTERCCAVGKYSAKLFDMAQTGFDFAVHEFEGDAGKPDPIEIALQDGRETEIPHRRADDQSLGLLQSVDIGFYQRRI